MRKRYGRPSPLACRKKIILAKRKGKKTKVKRSPSKTGFERYSRAIAYISNEESNEIELMIASTKAFIENKVFLP
jgi:hypothetical protein